MRHQSRLELNALTNRKVCPDSERTFPDSRLNQSVIEHCLEHVFLRIHAYDSE